MSKNKSTLHLNSLPKAEVEDSTLNNEPVMEPIALKVETKVTEDGPLYKVKRNSWGGWKIVNAVGAGLVPKRLRGGFTHMIHAEGAIANHLSKVEKEKVQPSSFIKE